MTDSTRANLFKVGFMLVSNTDKKQRCVCDNRITTGIDTLNSYRHFQPSRLLIYNCECEYKSVSSYSLFLRISLVYK